LDRLYTQQRLKRGRDAFRLFERRKMACAVENREAGTRDVTV
jgi:hypothetical protein